MRNSILRAKGFDRRTFIFGGAGLGVMSALAGRLYYLQIIQADEYRTLSDENRIRLTPVLSTRGKILDRRGKIITENIKTYRVLAGTSGKEDEQLVSRLTDILQLSEERGQKLLEELKDNPRDNLILLKDKLSWKDVSVLEVYSHEIPGMVVEEMLLRNYPFKMLSGHLAGYVGPVSSRDVENHPLFNMPGYRIGRSGIEKSQETSLHGKEGIKRLEVNAHGIKVRELSLRKSTPGRDIKLSVDMRLQKFVAKELAGKGGLVKEGGSAIILDIDTGEILAMVSVPGYDPNQFIGGISGTEWNKLIHDPDKPLINKAIARQYPPGSTFKTMVALAGLHSGIVTSETTHYCPGFIEVGGRKFHCWRKEGHGHMNLEDAITQSCNVYFYEISRKIGVDRIAEMARKFGLGSLTGIGLPGESSGLIPTKKWKKETLGERWYVGETINVGIGQGHLLTTPLQLAIMTARLASRGNMVEPHLIKNYTPGQKTEAGHIDVLPWHIDLVLRGMDRAVNSPEGVAHYIRIKEKKYAMGGKTGTAQVRRRLAEGAEPKDRKHKYHSLFVGYAPVKKPRYAAAVVIEHGGYGAAAAAPVGNSILYKVQKMAEE